MKRTHVVIKGMEEIPRTCAECPMAVSDNGYEFFCNRLKTDILVDVYDPSEQRHDDCPLYEEEVTE